MSPTRAQRARAAGIAELASLGFALPGTLIERHVRCGRANCRCRADPPALHGPYWQWTRKVAGKTITRLVPTAPSREPVQVDRDVQGQPDCERQSSRLIDAESAVRQLIVVERRGQVGIHAFSYPNTGNNFYNGQQNNYSTDDGPAGMSAQKAAHKSYITAEPRGRTICVDPFKGYGYTVGVSIAGFGVWAQTSYNTDTKQCITEGHFTAHTLGLQPLRQPAKLRQHGAARPLQLVRRPTLTRAVRAATIILPPSNVFTVMTGVTQSGPTQVDEINDVGLPGLFNTAGARCG